MDFFPDVERQGGDLQGVVRLAASDELGIKIRVPALAGDLHGGFHRIIHDRLHFRGGDNWGQMRR